ncbi:MAG: hypothetical protein U1E28_16205 [Beijerinckiaceae bacterium]
MKSLIFAAACAAAACTPAAAASIPRFDFEKTCRAAPPAMASGVSAFSQCMTDERQARDQLQKTWSKAGSRARGQCASLTRLGGQPSYVELITCLEMENSAGAAARNDRLAPRDR